MHKENEGYVDSYILGNGISICFNQIYRSSWTKGDSSVFSDEMLILNFCRSGRCDVSLAQNRYAIVKERQVCVSTILPNKDFYYPGRLYEGVQIYIDRRKVREADGADFLTMMGIRTEQLVELFCAKEGLYLHRMNDAIMALYFRRKRMEKAAELLESTNLKVIEIANAVGYENQGKFAKVFAEWSGVSPLEFRRMSK